MITLEAVAAVSLTPTGEPGWVVQESRDLTGHGPIAQLLAFSDCGTQGCMFELRIGTPPNVTTLLRTLAKSCEILNTRSGGYADIECVQRYDVEVPGIPWIRVTNRYRWSGAGYTSPLDHVNDGVAPIVRPDCKTVRMTEPVDVLILPARGLRVSEPRSGAVPGWKAGPARTPIIGHLNRGARVPTLEQVMSPKTGVWLRVRLGANSAGWVSRKQTRCTEAKSE
jgi:hypothetical protein